MNKPVIPAKAGIQHLQKWIPAFAGMTMFIFAQALALPLETPLQNPAQEAAAREIFRELRCVVCQSESIADSSAQVASDMRREIRTQITAGKSHNEIIAYFTAHYGDFVLMQPPFKTNTALLWFGPLMLLIIAGVFVFIYFRRHATSSSPEFALANSRAIQSSIKLDSARILQEQNSGNDGEDM